MNAIYRLRQVTREFFGPIAYIHITELLWPRSFMVRSWCNLVKVTLRSTKISIKWLRTVKVTREVIKRRPIFFCWSCDGGPLKWDNLRRLRNPGFLGIDSASLCSLAGRYDNPICRTGQPGWESIPGLLKRFANTGSVLTHPVCASGSWVHGEPLAKQSAPQAVGPPRPTN
jgi:hypothetical protein